MHATRGGMKCMLLMCTYAHERLIHACMHVPQEELRSPVSLMQALGPAMLQTAGGLGGIWLADKLIIKRIFQVRHMHAWARAIRLPHTPHPAWRALCDGLAGRHPRALLVTRHTCSR